MERGVSSPAGMKGRPSSPSRRQGRHIKFTLPLPDKDDARFKERVQGLAYGHKKRVPLTPEQSAKVYEQETRTRFRALVLCIKAKLESVESGIESFEEAFLAHIVLPDKSLVGDRVRAMVQEAYRTGSMGNLLPANGDSHE